MNNDNNENSNLDYKNGTYLLYFVFGNNKNPAGYYFSNMMSFHAPNKNIKMNRSVVIGSGSITNNTTLVFQNNLIYLYCNLEAVANRTVQVQITVS